MFEAVILTFILVAIAMALSQRREFKSPADSKTALRKSSNAAHDPLMKGKSHD